RGSDDWTLLSQAGQPPAVSDKASAAVLICAQLPRKGSRREESVCRPSQDRTRIARMPFGRVAIGPAIKKATSSHMPHTVEADHEADSARQCLQPTGNVEPVRDHVKVHHINFSQIRWSRRRQ